MLAVLGALPLLLGAVITSTFAMAVLNGELIETTNPRRWLYVVSLFMTALTASAVAAGVIIVGMFG